MFPQKTEPSELLSGAANAFRNTNTNAAPPKRNSIAGIITSITASGQNHIKDLPSFILVDDHEDRSVISELAQECYVLHQQPTTNPPNNITTANTNTNTTNAQSSTHANPLQPGLATLGVSANNSFGADVL